VRRYPGTARFARPTHSSLLEWVEARCTELAAEGAGLGAWVVLCRTENGTSCLCELLKKTNKKTPTKTPNQNKNKTSPKFSQTSTKTKQKKTQENLN